MASLRVGLALVSAWTVSALRVGQTIRRPSVLASTVYSIDDKVINSPLEPLDNYLLIKVGSVVDSSRGGVLLPEMSKEKPSEGQVVACGEGRTHPETAVLMPVSVVAGESVIYGKYDGTAVSYCGQDHQLIRDDDVLLAWAGDAMTVEAVRPVRDRVLMRKVKMEEETASGIALAPGVAEQQQTSVGEVVKVGDGRLSSAGSVTPMPVEIGDKLKFRDYAGSEIKIEGDDYVVCRMIDCLSKWR